MVQITAQPASYLDGQDTRGNLTPLPNSAGSLVIPGIVVGVGQTAAENNFGEILPASVSGYVYHDANNDGTFQGAESPIVGTWITLTGSDDLGPIASMTVATDAFGFYRFGGLRPGTYSVAEAQPASHLDGQDTTGTGAASGSLAGNDGFAVSLAAGDTGVDFNFGEVLPVTVSGLVYFDANTSTTKDAGDTPLGGVTIKLTGTDDLGGSVSLTTVTAADGTFSFGGVTPLRPGSYTLTEAQPTGYNQGTNAAGSAGGSLATQDAIGAFTLTPGTNAAGYLFGETGSDISGTVYLDANKDGVLQPGETTRLSGVTVTLEDSPGNTVATTVTNASGNYSFPNLPPGLYSIVETQPGGYGSSTPNTLAVTLGAALRPATTSARPSPRSRAGSTPTPTTTACSTAPTPACRR